LYVEKRQIEKDLPFEIFHSISCLTPLNTLRQSQDIIVFILHCINETKCIKLKNVTGTKTRSPPTTISKVIGETKEMQEGQSLFIWME
jgi:hypothetical protein